MVRAGAPILALLVGASACHSREPVPGATQSASAKPSARPVASTAPHAPLPPPPPPIVGCRVLGVRGVSPPPPGTPPVGTPFVGKAWVDLAAGVELALKHGETTREFSLRGPGRFLVCADGEESVLVARGTVVTTPGPGSRGGAEVALGTPFGVVEYADAALTLTVGDAGLALDVKQGAASVGATVAEDQPGGAAPKSVRAPAGHLALKGKVDPAALAARCADAWQGVGAGKATPAPSAGQQPGQWAVGLLQARKSLRLTCARARAAVGRLDGPERTRLESLLGAPKPAPPAAADPRNNAGSDAGK